MRNKSPSRHCSYFCSKALFLPNIHSQQLFTALAELQLIFTPSDTMAALKCHCTCMHLSSFFPVFVADPIHSSPGCVGAELEDSNWIVTTAKPVLSRCSLWCSSGFTKCNQKAFSPSFFQNIANISFACMAKSTLVAGVVPCHINWQCWQPMQLQGREFTCPDAERSIAKAIHKQSQAQPFDWSVTPCWTCLKFIAS